MALLPGHCLCGVVVPVLYGDIPVHPLSSVRLIDSPLGSGVKAAALAYMFKLLAMPALCEVGWAHFPTASLGSSAKSAIKSFEAFMTFWTPLAGEREAGGLHGIVWCLGGLVHHPGLSLVVWYAEVA